MHSSKAVEAKVEGLSPRDRGILQTNEDSRTFTVNTRRQA
jgi:hypothetical protein